MIKRPRLFVLFVFSLLLWPVPGGAENGRLLTVDLAERHIDITTGFNGARLSVFGVREQAGDIAVVVRGPEREMVVRRKDPVMGVWLNRKSVTFDDVPVYYDFALSRPESRLASPATLEAKGIGFDSLHFVAPGWEDEETLGRFREALIRNKQTEGHFPLNQKNITFLSENFFRTEFYFPADVPTGNYTITTYLFRDGEIIDSHKTQLRVAQVGFSARVLQFAYNQGLAYGLTAVFMAVMAGLAAHTFLRRD